MSIKGTMETFNLCELLQMLAFNQKQGTLVLEALGGVRSLYLDKGELTFFEQDPEISASIMRMARYEQVGTPEQHAEALQRHADSGRSLPSVFQEMGLTDENTAAIWYREAAVEQLFEAQLTSVAGFEFVEGKAVGPDGAEGRPIRPAMPVESLLLDLARMLDHWNTVSGIVESTREIYEGTGIAVDLADEEDVDGDVAAVVIPCLDGCRSLEQIAEACHVTSHAVVAIAGALIRGGGIRAVPTDALLARGEDLLARGEAVASVPLFQRCIERGDAPLDARLRLADGYEASGALSDAAAELDTFATLSDEDADAVVVFQALRRALKLRDGDFATAARVCDYYLRRRLWLKECHGQATSALRDLIHGASTSGRPIEAADRLARFIESGDAPSEDLLMLADLYASGGERGLAAESLYRRAEDLLSAGRRLPARQMLRRVLELDPGHANAHRRKLEMDGTRRRQGHRARVLLILALLFGVGGAAFVAWASYNQEASLEVTDAQAEAERLHVKAVEQAKALIEDFRVRAENLASSAEEPKHLPKAAAKLHMDIERVMATVTPALEKYKKEIGDYAASGNDGIHRDRLDTMARKKDSLAHEVDGLIKALSAQAAEALVEGEQAYGEGELIPALELLRVARNLSFADPTTHQAALKSLAFVVEYHKLFGKVKEGMLAATEAGDFAKAFHIGSVAIRNGLYNSDLTRSLKFPVRIRSEPPGAEVWLGEDNTKLVTPCVLTYSPFHKNPLVTLRLPGCAPFRQKLPSDAAIQRDQKALRGWDPVVAGTLKPGWRWRKDDPEGRVVALWSGVGVLYSVAEQGRTTRMLDPLTGTPVEGAVGEKIPTRLRAGGRLKNGTQWTISGRRTLRVLTPTGERWEIQTVGGLKRAPLFVEGQAIVVDEMGTLYAHAVDTGKKRWSTALGAPASQAPRASPLGILMATTTGSAYRINPVRGTAVELAPEVADLAWALPLGEGALFLGGGKDGARLVGPDKEVRVLGDASPSDESRVYVSEEGVAWHDAKTNAIMWLGANGRLLTLSGLGEHVEYICGSPGCLYGTTTNGSVRCVKLSAPADLAFEAPLGGRAEQAPFTLGRALFVLVDGAIVAIEL